MKPIYRFPDDQLLQRIDQLRHIGITLLIINVTTIAIGIIYLATNT